MKTHIIKFLHLYYSVFRSIKLYFKASWISILIILVVMVLLTQMGQGTTIIIDLFERPFNVLLTMILTSSLALVLSHYPDYIEKNIGGNNLLSSPGKNKGVYAWEMPIRISCFGIIIYKELKGRRLDYLRRFDFLKRLQSVLLFLSIIIVLFYAYKVHINPTFKLGLFNGLYLVFSIGLYSWVYKLKKKRERIRKLAILGTIFFWLKALTGVVGVLYSYLYGWHPSTFFILLTYFTLAIVWYSFFRNIRFNLQFYRFAYPVNLLSNNKNFVLLMSTFGWLALLIFGLSQYKVLWFNPIVIILTLLYTTYGLIIHPIKHKLYYAHIATEHPEELKCKLIRYTSLFLVPIAIVLFSLLVGISIKYGNELHKLHPVTEGRVIQEQEFKKKMFAHLARQKDSTIYFIASYGGGLTANAWNSLLLDTLTRFNGQNILESTVAMSGVSGGAMGHGIYTAIYKNYTDRIHQKKIIEHIDNTNFISLDISWMFGWDFVREWYINKDSFSANRAKRSMCEYEYIIKDRTMSEKSFRSYWAELFLARHSYPALLTNTASTHSTRGISCSIQLDDFEKAFPGAENILEHDQGKSLSFSDALSTSNRFPLLSPAAKIEGYGHYVDGGYFENSGMLSLFNFYEYLSSDSLWERYLGKHKVVFIQIMNSKSDWINELLTQKERIVKKTQESGEVAAVINTIVSIDKLPRYFNALLKTKTNLYYVPIALPYHLRKEDFEAVLKAEKLDTNLDSLIYFKNRWLRTVRSTKGSPWETAEPPLARLLSEPAFKYMQAVIEDGEIFKSLQQAQN